MVVDAAATWTDGSSIVSGTLRLAGFSTAASSAVPSGAPSAGGTTDSRLRLFAVFFFFLDGSGALEVEAVAEVGSDFRLPAKISSISEVPMSTVVAARGCRDGSE